MKRAFTLVELLVVIGVIAILAAITLPAINKSLEKAMQTNCANNLGQLAKAEIAYAADFGQKFLGGSTNEIEKCWVIGLFDYVKEPKTFKCDGDENDGVTENYGTAVGVLAVSFLNNTGLPSNKKRYLCDRPAHTMIYGPRKHREVNDPWGYTASATMSYINFDFDGEEARHNKNSNFAFLDGHVEAMGNQVFKDGNVGTELDKYFWSKVN